MNHLIDRLMGPKHFRQRAIRILIPMMIQMLITNFVNMLDNLMVGRVGTVEMTGVSVSNQILSVFFFSMYGIIGAGSIFGSQYFGKRDWEGMRSVFRMKLVMGGILLAAFVSAILLKGPFFIGLFLRGEGTADEAAQMLQHGWDYMKIMLIGQAPYMLSQFLSGSLREAEETRIPMVAGIIATSVNLCLNWVLIFGNLGAPALGARGAAVATVISRFTELFYIYFRAMKKRGQLLFLNGLLSSLRIPRDLMRKMLTGVFPLIANETIFSLANTMVQQSLSLRSIYVMAALNICFTLSNVCQAAVTSVANAAGIIVGQRLGQSNFPKAKEESRQLHWIMLGVSLAIGGVMAVASPFFPLLYKTEANVRELASTFILIEALIQPPGAIFFCSYMTIRAGGKTWLTFLSDACMDSLKCLIVFVIARATSLPIIPFFLIAEGWMFLKALFGLWLYKRDTWLQNVVDS